MPQTAQFDPNATYQPDSAVVASFDPNATYAPAKASTSTAAPGDDRSLLDHLANDPNTVPLDSYTHATERGIANIGQGGAQAVQGTLSLLNPTPQDEHEKKIAAINPLAVPVYRLLRGLGHSAGDAVRLAQAYKESGGPSLEELGDVAGTTAGNVIAGEAMGEGTGAAGRGVKAAIEAPAETVKAVATAPVRLAARTAEAAINQKLVPAKPLLRIMTPADEAEAVHVKVPGRDLGLPPKAAPTPAAAPTPTPAINTTAGEQASLPLIMGEHLGEEAAPAASPEPARAAAPAQFDLPAQFDPNATYKPAAAEAPKPASATPAKVESLLNDSLGGKPLEKNVPLRQQVPQASTAKSGATSSRELPAGFTPTESSVLAGYKYDPATQEFESITNAGQHYVHGEVTPDQAADFEATDSKGKAWNKLRGSSVLVAKVLNGVRKPITGFSAVESGAAAGDVVPKKQAGMRSVEIDPETGHPEFSDVIAARKPKVAPAADAGIKSPTVTNTAAPDLVPIERYSAPGNEKGRFYAPAGEAVADFGEVLSKAHVDASQLYKGTSSIDLAKEGGYYDKPIPPEAAEQVAADHAMVEPEWIKEHNLPPQIKTLGDLAQYEGFINGDGSYHAFQLAAEKYLKAKGYKGAYWSEEDDMNPRQYQIWDRSAVHEAAEPAPKPAAGPPSPKPASAEASPKAAAAGEDLTPLLQQSLDKVNLDKGAVHTTAAPADLAKRWGVDSQSLAAGREQTRGMSAEQTEQYIAKLVESYKRGTPVEPVMETRDAGNNIIAVDGRARAIAAGRAGVKRIPIIVRRLKKP